MKGQGGGRRPLAKAELRIISQAVEQGLNLDFPILDQRIVQRLATFRNQTSKSSFARAEVWNHRETVPREEPEEIPETVPAEPAPEPAPEPLPEEEPLPSPEPEPVPQEAIPVSHRAEARRIPAKLGSPAAFSEHRGSLSGYRDSGREIQRAEVREGASTPRIARFLSTATGRGTLLIGKRDIARLTEEQWENLFKAVYGRSELRLVVYEEAVQTTDNALLERRLGHLEELDNARIPNVGAQDALKYRIPNQMAMFVTIDGMPQEIVELIQKKTLSKVFGTKLGERHDLIWIALLYVISDGRLDVVIQGYNVVDANPAYLDKIQEHILQQVIAWSA